MSICSSNGDSYQNNDNDYNNLPQPKILNQKRLFSANQNTSEANIQSISSQLSLPMNQVNQGKPIIDSNTANNQNQQHNPNPTAYFFHNLQNKKYSLLTEQQQSTTEIYNFKPNKQKVPPTFNQSLLNAQNMINQNNQQSPTSRGQQKTMIQKTLIKIFNNNTLLSQQLVKEVNAKQIQESCYQDHSLDIKSYQVQKKQKQQQQLQNEQQEIAINNRDRYKSSNSKPNNQMFLSQI
ncbi:UNKNOWN [Stylonychia lemnae]|uniref:Uncharacterized protein n=1 Tax=Stylonychia lemnae TaxID=5949 RepID=A0A078B1V4_STYLE|nr:UNKNOWN [Stylonychia lemnae]|eukprot:CDW87298.1 UNKNOWN [Stylonychia lemnae]